jgi:tRNA(Leu) C34 or U34 (ribose-2'-O)-methylase TrmL
LNVSTSAAVLVFEAVRQREKVRRSEEVKGRRGEG